MSPKEITCELTEERINFVNGVVDEAWRLMSVNGLIVAEGALAIYQLVDRLSETMEQTDGDQDVDVYIDQVIYFLQRMHTYVKTGDEGALVHV